IEPDKEGLSVLLGLVHKRKCPCQDLVVHRLHALGIERSLILDGLLTDLAPARLIGGIVCVGCRTCHHVARAQLVLERLRIVGMVRVFHRIEVVEYPKNSSKPCTHGRNWFKSPRWFLPNCPVAYPTAFTAVPIVGAWSGLPIFTPPW